MSDTVSAHGDGTNVFFDPENNFAPIFLDSFKSRDYIYKGNIFEPVPPCKPCLCFVYRQFDEDLLPLWLQAKTFLLSRETVRAFLSFTNRNINLDQCQSFFPLGSLSIARYTCVCFSLWKLKPHKNTVFGCRCAMPVEVRCYVCSYCTRAVSSIAVLWGHLLGRCAPAVRHIMSQTNRRETRSILVTCETENKNLNSIFVCRQHGRCLILSRCFYFWHLR